MEKLRDTLEAYFDEQMVDRIEYKQWTTTDRSTLETKVQSVDSFLTDFTDALPKVVTHDFIAKQQSAFFAESKLNIVPGEFVVIADFAENYSFVVQDASQSFHWNNLQATIHPFVCYYKVQSDNSEFCLQHTSFVIISENNIHDTIAVHLYQKALITHPVSHRTLLQASEDDLLFRWMCSTV